MRKQECFTPTDDELIPFIVETAQRERRTKSEMIDILLHQAMKVRIYDRKRKNAKDNNP